MISNKQIIKAHNTKIALCQKLMCNLISDLNNPPKQNFNIERPKQKLTWVII